MKWLLPYPALTAALLVLWLLLAGWSVTSLLLGVVIAVAASQSLRAVGGARARMRLGWPLVRLLVLLAVDIWRSNMAVARIILTDPPRQPGFIRLPTALRNRAPLAAMAAIITATPGTIWVHHDAEQHIILIHVLDLVDEEAWIAQMKGRYEALLMEIFPC